jgi:hypothetical protein
MNALALSILDEVGQYNQWPDKKRTGLRQDGKFNAWMLYIRGDDHGVFVNALPPESGDVEE